MKAPTNPPGARRATRLRHFSASLPMLLLRAREAVMVHFRPMLREQGLTEQQWRVLRALDPGQPVEVSQLASATFLLGPSLSRILPELEAQGLVATGTHGTDQRRKLVWLTPAGAGRKDEIAPLSEAIYAELTARVGPARLAELQAQLAELEAGLRANGAAEPGRPEAAGRRATKAGHRRKER